MHRRPKSREETPKKGTGAEAPMDKTYVALQQVSRPEVFDFGRMANRIPSIRPYIYQVITKCPRAMCERRRTTFICCDAALSIVYCLSTGQSRLIEQ